MKTPEEAARELAGDTINPFYNANVKLMSDAIQSRDAEWRTEVEKVANELEAFSADACARADRARQADLINHYEGAGESYGQLQAELETQTAARQQEE